jgi:hypothetical protein
MKQHPLVYIDTMLQYHLNVDVDKLSDEEWAIKFRVLEDIRSKEADANQ